MQLGVAKAKLAEARAATGKPPEPAVAPAPPQLSQLWVSDVAFRVAVLRLVATTQGRLACVEKQLVCSCDASAAEGAATS